ncbi:MULTISPECIES: hypothetical protein [Serratia]|jgi:hypothetical protein|uniref:hypothetical protein n=1 Tax=Serratia TaxID=613 RepID=UPI000650D07B|nr:hypothetical protein [Serratia marcescens]MBN5204928.1 hypothetical protein [Serratia marcescens]PYA59332.1 hypothetical protein DMW53_14845 [Serratia marcescens]PYB17770.1 hypothetical protein DMW55_13560 [Serratia marcescens]HBK4790609.1 hypothetical protein [Serratia marcescens]
MIPYRKVESLAACRMTEQQIADVLDIDLGELKREPGEIAAFREAIRKGRAKGEAEIRTALYRKAKGGDPRAFQELLRREKQQDSD